MYLVMKQITWGASNILFDDGLNITTGTFYQVLATPRIAYSDAFEVITSTNFAVNTWAIVTLVINGINSRLRINLLAGTTNDIITNRNGISLGCYNVATPGQFGNCEFAYIIMRNVADSTAVQNNFINWLKNRFAI